MFFKTKHLLKKDNQYMLHCLLVPGNLLRTSEIQEKIKEVKLAHKLQQKEQKSLFVHVTISKSTITS